MSLDTPIARARITAIACVTVLAALAALAASPALAGDWTGEIVTEDGTKVVKNPATAMADPVSVDLEEMWRVGGDTDSEDEFFGVITSIDTDKDGNVYLLDLQLAEIKVFSPAGEYIRTIGREGEGPGEFRLPISLLLFDNGEIGVIQLMPGKIVRFGADGQPMDDYPLPESGGTRVLINGAVAGDNLVLACIDTQMEEGKLTQTRFLMVVDREGNEITRYHSEDRTLDFANLVLDESVWDTFEQRWTVGPDARVFAQLRPDNYDVNVWNPDGSVNRIIEREHTLLDRTAAERDSIENLFARSTQGQGNFSFKIRDHHRAVDRLYVRDDGSLWVTTPINSRGLPDGALTRFDVFDGDGRFVQQVTLLGEGDPTKDGLFFVQDRLYVVKGLMDAAMAMRGAAAGEETDEEPEPVAVICYRIDGKLLALK